MTINSSDLSWRDLLGTGTGVSARGDTTSFPILGITSSGAEVSTFGSVCIYIPNYASTTTYKSVNMDGASETNATQAITQLSGGLYASNSAVSSITFTPYNSPTALFVQYSTAYIYGIKNS
jgi:hypothetical protein